jgi:carbonic anhydrase
MLAPMSVTDELIRNNESYAGRFDATGLSKLPAKQLAVVVCMDTRLNPYEILGLAPGDAHVIRNAGGIVGDEEIRSLAISQRKLGTREVVLIHHTDCGMLGLDDEEFARELESETGAPPPWRAGGFADLEQDVRDSIARIRESPFIPHTDSVRGFVYEVETGRLREVDAL